MKLIKKAHTLSCRGDNWHPILQHELEVKDGSKWNRWQLEFQADCLGAGWLRMRIGSWDRQYYIEIPLQKKVGPDIKIPLNIELKSTKELIIEAKASSGKIFNLYSPQLEIARNNMSINYLIQTTDSKNFKCNCDSKALLHEGCNCGGC